MSEEMMIAVSVPVKKRPFLKNLIFISLIIAISLISIWIGFLQFQMPEVLPQSAGKELFSSERAVKYLEQIVDKPRPTGSVENDRVRDYLLSELTGFGLSPEIQSAEDNLTVWGTPYEGKIENIVARIPGKASSGTIMITSHYDTDPHSPGAADAGSGVAAILETVRAVMETSQLKNDIVILISDGEEIGLLGAQAFAQDHPWAQDIDIVLNFEARGSGGPSVLFETNEQNERLVAEFVKEASNPVAHSFINELYKTMPNNTDFSIYKPSGVHGLNFAFFEDIYGYHSHEDTVENLDLQSLQHHGDNMLELVQHLGNMELVAKKDSEVLFFNAVGKKVVIYSEKLVIPIMLLVVTIYALICVFGFRQNKLTFFGVGAGFLLFLIMMFISYFAGNILWFIISSMKGWTPWLIRVYPIISNPVFISIILMVLALNMVIYWVANKRVNAENLTMGALFGWLVLACLSSLLFKGTSYVFVWPLMFGLLALGGYMYLNRKHPYSANAIYISTIVPILVFLGPIIYLVFVLLTIDHIGILMICSSIVAAYMIPLLNQIKGKYYFIFPTILLLAGLLILITIYIKVI